MRRIAAISFVSLVVTLFTTGCGTPEPGPEGAGDGAWVGTIETEGGTTTVINESGSVWGGTATLVEEASIGVEAGADEYMFGFIESVWATEDRIYVVDSQVPAVRIYDHDGDYLGDLGSGPGEGPGEYIDPGMLAVAPDGRIFLLAFRGDKILIYGPDGSFLEAWPSTHGGLVASGGPMLFSSDGVLWMRITEYGRQAIERRYGTQAHGPDGLFGPRYYVDADGEPDLPTLSLRQRGVGQRELPVPLAPELVWQLVGPAMLAVGTSDEYRFEYRRHGRTARVVERYWEPIPIDPDRREWTRRLTMASIRQMEPGWEWDGPEMPEHLPAYSSFLPAHSGVLWARRPAPGERQADCVQDPVAAGIRAARQSPCWRERWKTDVFGEDGRYLGEVDLPPNVRPFPSHLFVRGDLVVAALFDDAGTPMVKRYRLVLP